MVLQYLRSKKNVTAIAKITGLEPVFAFTYANQQVFAHDAAHFISGLELKTMKQWHDTF